MTRYTYTNGMKLKLPKCWCVTIYSTSKKGNMYIFNNKMEAVRYYYNQLAKNPYLVIIEERTLKGSSYKDKTLEEYRSPENKKHLKELWGE